VREQHVLDGGADPLHPAQHLRAVACCFALWCGW
jgi:hypothetical protein